MNFFGSLNKTLSTRGMGLQSRNLEAEPRASISIKIVVYCWRILTFTLTIELYIRKRQYLGKLSTQISGPENSIAFCHSHSLVNVVNVMIKSQRLRHHGAANTQWAFIYGVGHVVAGFRLCGEPIYLWKSCASLTFSVNIIHNNEAKLTAQKCPGSKLFLVCLCRSTTRRL